MFVSSQSAGGHFVAKSDQGTQHLITLWFNYGANSKDTEAPWNYRWSSAHAHLKGKSDNIVNVEPLLDLLGYWKAFLSGDGNQSTEEFELHERTGRPLGDRSFFDKVSEIVGKDLKRKKSGPKVKGN